MRYQRRDFGSPRTRKKSLDATDPKSRSGVAKSMETCLGLFFHTCFAMKVPMQRTSFCTFQRGLWKRFCVRGAIQIPTKRRKQKKRFFLFFAFGGNLYCYADPKLDLEPVWEARFCTVAYVNSFAKIFGICPISQRRYSCFLGSLRRSVFRYPLQNRALMKIKVFARKGCKN